MKGCLDKGGGGPFCFLAANVIQSVNFSETCCLTAPALGANEEVSHSEELRSEHRGVCGPTGSDDSYKARVKRSKYSQT